MDEKRRDDRSEAASDAQETDVEGHGSHDPTPTDAPGEMGRAHDVEGHANMIGSADPDEPGSEVKGHVN